MIMREATLGRTGLQTAVAGLGCGGHSALGLKRHGEKHAATIVRAAYDAGVTFFDTAKKYGTQSAVEQGLAGLARDSYILSTKFDPMNKSDRTLKSVDEFSATLDESLRVLRTDYIDIYHLQGVFYDLYPQVCARFIPALQQAKEQGKIRFTAVSEDFPGDTDHKMLRTALEGDFFDVYMLGYNLLNQSAARTILPRSQSRGVGTLCMYAVRNMLSTPERLRANIELILAAGQADPEKLSADEDLSFIIKEGAAQSITEAAYRFCSNTEGINIVLTGTGSMEHLRENIAAINAPPLPGAILEKLSAMFGNVDCIAGN